MVSYSEIAANQRNLTVEHQMDVTTVKRKAEIPARLSAATNEMSSNEDENATRAEARKSAEAVLASDLCGLGASVVVTFLQLICGVLECKPARPTTKS